MEWPEKPTCHRDAWPVDTLEEWISPREGNDFRTCAYCGSIRPQDLVRHLEAGATLRLADAKYGWPHKFYVDGVPDQREGKLIPCGSKPLEDRELVEWLRGVREYEQQLLIKSERFKIELDTRLLETEQAQELLGCLKDPIYWSQKNTALLSRAVRRVQLVASQDPSLDRDRTLTRNPLYRPATTSFAKWYNNHLLDEGYDTEAWNKLRDLIEQKTGIQFLLREEKLAYTCTRPST